MTVAPRQTRRYGITPETPSKTERFVAPNNPFSRVESLGPKSPGKPRLLAKASRAVAGQAEAKPLTIERIIGVTLSDSSVNTATPAAMSIDSRLSSKLDAQPVSGVGRELPLFLVLS